jgi:hypothetical protein
MMEIFVPESDRAMVYDVMRRIQEGKILPTDSNENGILNATKRFFRLNGVMKRYEMATVK